MNTTTAPSRWNRAAPGLLLMLAAPLCAEVLPGATRLSSLFVLPVEILVWGGGALMIREIVRRRQLGWTALLLLGLALAVAEECLIQQTSLAPIVIKLKGVEYGRAWGINYVYLLWALVYEAVLVVLVPVALVELVFPSRGREPWMSRGAAIAVPILFVAGAFFAWFTWTQIARVKVFHLPAFNPPIAAIAIAAAVIAGLVAFALGQRPAHARAPARNGTRVPPRGILGIVGGVGAILWYGLVLLAFGIAPSFPPTLAVVGGLAVCVALLATLPRWVARAAWTKRETFAVVVGTMLGAMGIGFAGFIGSTRADLWFKIVANIVAVGLLVQLGRKVAQTRDRGVAALGQQ